MRACWALLLALAACRDPTQITLELSTDVACSELAGTSITVGELGALEDKPPVAISDGCVDGRLGSLVAVPADEGAGEVGFKVVSSVGAPLEACVAPDYGPSCIVARRVLGYVEHQPLLVPIAMRSVCQGVSCPIDQTCAAGVCRPARVDVALCAGPEGCGEDALAAPADVPATWPKRFGAGGTEQGLAIATDAAGNVYLTGAFQSQIDFGGEVLESAGSDDIFVASFTADGSHRWSQRFGDVSSNIGRALAIDPDGNLYLAGATGGAIDFGGGPIAYVAATDTFLASFSSDGVHRWSSGFGSAGYDDAHGVAVDSTGNAYLAGELQTGTDFGGGVLFSTGVDAFVASFSSDGTYRWDETYATTADDVFRSVAVGGGTVVAAGDRKGQGFAFFALYSQAGQPQFMSDIESMGSNDYVTAAGLDASGNVYLTGSFDGAIQFEPPGILSQGDNDIFLASLTSTGSHRWTIGLGGTATDSALGLVVAPDGTTYLAGRFQASADFGGETLASAGGDDLFVASFDPDGVHRWSQSGAGSDFGTADSLALGQGDDLFGAGSFDGMIRFDDGAELSSDGLTDAFVARFRTSGP